MNEQKIASSQRSGGSKGLHLPARTVSRCFPNQCKSLFEVGPRQDCPSGSLLCRLHALRDGGQGGRNTGFHLTDQPMCCHKISFSFFKCSDSWYCEHHRCVRIWVQASQGNWSRGWKEYGEVLLFCCLLFCKIVSKLKYLWGGDMKLLFENLFIEGELFQCQLPTLHEANPRSSCSKVFLRQKKTYKPTPISRLSPNFSGFSTWCSIC